MPSDDVKMAKGREDQLIKAFKVRGFTLKITKNLLRDRTYTITDDKTGEFDTFETQEEIEGWLDAAGFTLAEDADHQITLAPVEAQEEAEPAPPVTGVFNGRVMQYTPPQSAQEATYDESGKQLTPGRAATAGGWEDIGPAEDAPPGADVLEPQEDGSVRVMNADGTYQTTIPAPKQAATPPGPDKTVENFGGTGRTAIVDEYGRFKGWATEKDLPSTGAQPITWTDPATGQQWYKSSDTGGWQRGTPPQKPSVDEQIANALARGDVEAAQRLFDFKNQMTETERVQAGMNLREQALRIGQSPGDWWTYYSRLYGNQPSVDFQLGARAIPGYAGGLLGGEQAGLPYLGEPQQQGVQKPAFGVDSQAMDDYQRQLDAERNRTLGNGLTLEQQMRYQSGQDKPSGGWSDAEGTSIANKIIASLRSGEMTPEEAQRRLALVYNEGYAADLVRTATRGRGAPTAPFAIGQNPALGTIDRQIQALVSAGDAAETPEDQAAVQQRISELQAERQKIWGEEQAASGRGGTTERSMARTAAPNTLRPLGQGGDLSDPSGNPNMIGVRDRTGAIRWVNRNDQESVDMARNQGAPPAATGTGQPYPSGKFDPGFALTLPRRPGFFEEPSRPSNDVRALGSQVSQPTNTPLAPNDPWQGWNAAHGYAPAPGDTGRPLGSPGDMQWPSRGLTDVSGGGQVSGQRLLPTLGAPRFLSPQTESGLTPSERAIYSSEVQNQGFNLPDYEYQKRRQMGGFAGGSAGYLGGGGRRGVAPRRLGR